jgi:archaemetzincin
MSYVYISLIEPTGNHDLEGLRDEIQKVFRAETRIIKSKIEISSAYDPIRSQYDASALLLRLLEDQPPDACAILGITEVDLFVPIFEFLFGMAQLNGAGAILSTYRLKNELYGLHPDRILFAERLIKEALHELGHTFGLVHCFNPQCAMNPSTYVEQIDVKSKELCRQCRTSINEKKE